MMKTLVLALAAAFMIAPTWAKWSNTSEANATVNGGNSESTSYSLKTMSSKSLTEMDTIKFGGEYNSASAGDATSAENMKAFLRYERTLSAKTNWFLSETWRKDRFAGIDQELATDLGIQYHWIKEEKMGLSNSLSYRYSLLDFRDGTDSNESQIVVRADAFKQFTDTVRGDFYAEYVPSISESDNWNLNFGAGLAVAMSTNLSLKLGYEGKYDNLPAAAKKYDWKYTTGLIAKF